MEMKINRLEENIIDILVYVTLYISKVQSFAFNGKKRKLIIRFDELVSTR